MNRWLPLLQLGVVLAFGSPAFAQSKDVDVAITNASKIVVAYSKLLDDDRLPGIRKDQHGELQVQRLSSSLTTDWLKEKRLAGPMINELHGYKEVYIVWVRLKDSLGVFCYFFIRSNEDELLFSAYQYRKENWEKLPLIPGAGVYQHADVIKRK